MAPIVATVRGRVVCPRAEGKFAIAEFASLADNFDSLGVVRLDQEIVSHERYLIAGIDRLSRQGLADN